MPIPDATFLPELKARIQVAQARANAAHDAVRDLTARHRQALLKKWLADPANQDKEPPELGRLPIKEAEPVRSGMEDLANRMRELALMKGVNETVSDMQTRVGDYRAFIESLEASLEVANSA